jgi:hypothetical protein
MCSHMIVVFNLKIEGTHARAAIHLALEFIIVRGDVKLYSAQSAYFLRGFGDKSCASALTNGDITGSLLNLASIFLILLLTRHIRIPGSQVWALRDKESFYLRNLL